MQQGSGFWVANILHVIAVLVAGFSGAWIATRWRFYREIRLGHFEKIKQTLILPLLHIFRTELVAKLDGSHSNVEAAPEDILNGEEKRIGIQYKLIINRELADFLQYQSFYGHSIRPNLLEDLMNHFPKTARLLQEFIHQFEEHNQQCMDTVKRFQRGIERICKEIGFDEGTISREFYSRPSHVTLNTPGIAVWVYRRLLKIKSERLEKKHSYGDSWELEEVSSRPLAIGRVDMIERLYDFSYTLANCSSAMLIEIWQIDLEKIIKRMKELLNMRTEIMRQLEVIDSSNYLPGGCRFLKA